MPWAQASALRTTEEVFYATAVVLVLAVGGLFVWAWLHAPALQAGIRDRRARLTVLPGGKSAAKPRPGPAGEPEEPPPGSGS